MKRILFSIALVPACVWGQARTAVLNSLPVNVTAFGCAGDGVTNDSKCINAAVAAAQPGSTIAVPAKMFAIGDPIILGEGKGLGGFCGTSARSTATCSSGFVALPSLRGKSMIAVTGSGSEISGLFFKMNSVAANSIELHSDAAYGANIHNNSFITASPVTPKTLYDGTHYIFVNGTGPNGLYGLNIARNWFWDGIKDAIYAVNGGDSDDIRDNLFSLSQGGGGHAIYWSSVPTASHLVIENNNITGGSQMIYIRDAYEPKILKNQIEMPFPATGTYGSMITLDSIRGGGQIELNNINTMDHVTDAIHLKNAPDITVRENTISHTVAAGKGQAIATDAQSVRITWSGNINGEPGSDAPAGTILFRPVQSRLRMARNAIPFYNSASALDEDPSNLQWNPVGHYLTAGAASSIDSLYMGGFRLMNNGTAVSRYYYKGGVIMDRVAGANFNFDIGGSTYNQFDARGNLVFSNNKGQHINTQSSRNDISGACTFASGTCTITFATPYKYPPVCMATDQSNAVAVKAIPSTTRLVLVGASAAGSNDTAAYICIGNPE